VTDRVQRLREAAQSRHDATLRRAQDALHRLASRGEAVSYRRLAELAGVSRSWLYSQPDLRQQIDQLRGRPADRRQLIPAAERATTESLRQQLHAYHDELKRLRAENQEMREQLGRHLGTARAAAVTTRE
jgi:TolA-binding protein